MFLVQTVEVANLAIAVAQTHLVRSRRAVDLPGYLTVQAGQEVAEFDTPSLYPRMAHEFRGFQCLTENNREDGIWLQPLRSGEPMQWVEDVWVPLLDADPVFYTPAQLRSWLPQWVGGNFALRVRLVRNAQGDAPRLQAFKIGYSVAGDLLAYLCEHAFPSLLNRQAVELVRWAEPDATGTLPLPHDLDAERIESVQVFVPELGIQAAAIVGGRIVPETPVTTTTRLLILYAPSVAFAPGGFYQITTVPCVVLRLLRKENERQVAIADAIRISDEMSRVVQAAYCYDQEFEVTIAATNVEDCHLIGQHLATVINQVGKIEAYPYGVQVPVQVRQGVRLNQGSISIGSSGGSELKTATLRFAAIALTESDSWLDVPTATTYEFDTDAHAPVN